MKPWPQQAKEDAADRESHAALDDLPQSTMGLRWCHRSDGCYLKLTHIRSEKAAYSQVFDSTWAANRAAARGDLMWSNTEPDSGLDS